MLKISCLDLLAPFLLALVFLAPAHADDAAPSYAVPGSAVHELLSPQTGRIYSLYVKTPPGYDRAENREKTYPVVYLNDGELFFMTAAGETLLPVYNGAAAPVIIVGISYAKGEDAIASRQRDLTPVEDESFSNPTGGAGKYLSFLLDEIIPFVESRYRADPAHRALAGHSLGGTFAAYALLTDPTMFSDYILVSPALWFSDNEILRREAAYAASHQDLAARVFIAAGDLEGPRGGLKRVDMTRDMKGFSARLASRKYQSLALHSEVLEGGVNHSTSFAAGFARALLVFYPPAP